MIPQNRMFVAIALLTFVGMVGSFVSTVADVFPTAALGLLLTVVFDAAFGARVNAPSIERKTPGSMSLVTWVDVQLNIHNDSSPRRLTLRVFDHHPQSFATRDLPQTVSIAPGHSVDLSYAVRPMQRGPFTFLGCELRIASPLGLWWCRRFVPEQVQVRIYPNYSTISKLLAYEVDSQLPLAGVRLRRRRGEGIEFHQLRDYRDGDSMRSIDWKATARMSRLISREYQDERDQQIVFLLDAGRRMLAKDAELSHFDHALNAMLLLSYVALRQGDAAGVMTIGDKRTWLRPRKGVDAINGLLNHVYDIQPQPVEIDYVAAATDLAVRQRRRSLIVLLTNVREEDSDDLQIATDLLSRRHLVILASLRERALDDILAHAVHDFGDALRYASANQYLEARRESHKLLRAKGVFVDDCLSDELPAAITSRYLAIKRAGML